MLTVKWFLSNNFVGKAKPETRSNRVLWKSQWEKNQGEIKMKKDIKIWGCELKMWVEDWMRNRGWNFRHINFSKNIHRNILNLESTFFYVEFGNSRNSKLEDFGEEGGG